MKRLWIARDPDGKLCIFDSKPYRFCDEKDSSCDSREWYGSGDNWHCSIIQKDEDEIFRDIKSEDKPVVLLYCK